MIQILNFIYIKHIEMPESSFSLMREANSAFVLHKSSKITFDNAYRKSLWALARTAGAYA